MQIEPFTSSHLDEAAQLLGRSRRLLKDRPELTARYETPEGSVAAIDRELQDGAAGVVAVRDGRLEAFLLAVTDESADRGLFAWSSPDCFAFRDDADALRLLYTSLAPTWVEEGRAHHFVQTPTYDPRLFEAWLSLNFAYEHEHGIAALTERAPTVTSFEVRRAGPQDLDLLRPLFDLIGRAHQVTPVFAYVDPGFYDQLAEGHVELLEDENVGYFAALEDGAALGFAVMRGVPADEATFFKPEGAVELAVAATRPEARGRGVMSALYAASGNWAIENGYRTCVTDWRTANLDSSRVWPHLGFEGIGYRLHRMIDVRVLPERSS